MIALISAGRLGVESHLASQRRDRVRKDETAQGTQKARIPQDERATEVSDAGSQYDLSHLRPRLSAIGRCPQEARPFSAPRQYGTTT
ncbi:unnamed protein product [Heligmosomoides polygyrus]|uniref:Secreted protein n=1 Tax=Heligmosomoides polygyrus TaxID=6339 RepID=A0A183FIZ1_HELPZ|nr:unnamed protein product [Heligmosomoides polygyrus]